MTLPVINAPEYRLKVPSTDEEIKYRPFLVKEEKLLLMAQETGNENEIYGAIKKLIEQCCYGAVDVEKMPLFDLEYIFLQIRAKSIGDVSTVQITCPDDEKTKVKVDIDLSKIQVHMDEKHDARIQLTDDIGILMSYPHLGAVNMIQAGDEKKQMENLFQIWTMWKINI